MFDKCVSTTHSKLLLHLFANAQRDKVYFDCLLRSISEKSGGRGVESSLKSVLRICEKIVLKSDDLKYNVNRIFDIVRGAIVFSNMSSMLMALNHLIACSGAEFENTRPFKNDLKDAQLALSDGLPSIKIVRVKNRLLKPTEGGWSDVLINLCVDRNHGTNTQGDKKNYSIVCELQLINKEMYNVRHKLNGHVYYKKFRSAKEILVRRNRQFKFSGQKNFEWVDMYKKKIARDKIDTVSLADTVAYILSKIGLSQ